MEQIKQIIWDWNGTLLDDVEMCVNVMNVLLDKYNLPSLNCEKYKQIFDFPVIDYYSRLGFDFKIHTFEKIGLEFMDGYFNELTDCQLFSDVHIILDHFNKKGINQMVLSAMEHNALEDSLKKKGIHSYFSQVQGIDNHLAAGKNDLARGMLNFSGISASETLIIGDTLHDLHIAKSIESSCVLIANGHFSKERLQSNHNLIFDNLSDFMNYFSRSNIE